MLPFIYNPVYISKKRGRRSHIMFNFANKIQNTISLMILVVLIITSFAVTSCTPVNPYPSSQRTYQGAAAGAAVGSVAGLLIDKNNRWRGAMIGGLLGAALGGTVTEISQRASREAAQEGKPVVYQSNDGFQRVEATPVDYNQNTNCHKIRERIWQDGKLVKDEVKEVCESDKSEPVY